MFEKFSYKNVKILSFFCRWSNPAPDLAGDQLRRLQMRFKDVQLLIIDEKSMVSAVMMYQIDARLRQAKPEQANWSFGGLSVILMGDFAQLPPVNHKAMFEVKQTTKASAKGKLAYFEFDKAITFDVIMRQRGAANEEYRRILNDVADGNLKKSDYYQFLEGRNLDTLPNKDYFLKNATKYAAKNADLKTFNIEHIKALDGDVAPIKAVNKPAALASLCPPNKCMGLHNNLILSEGCKVMLTINLAKDLGLVNGKNNCELMA